MTHVLIVDDKTENLYLLRALLQGHGYTVDEARNGAEALTRARQTPPDLIISDLLMPVMDGYKLLREWKADERLQAIPFVVYTATYTEPRDERFAMDLGADEFIIKPLDPDLFVSRIEELLAKKTVGDLQPTEVTQVDELGLLKEYSEVLIRKLEKKVLDLEQTNRGLLEEIERRKEAEEALQESEARYRGLFDHMSDAVALYKAADEGEDFLFVDFNTAGEQMEGVRKGEILGKSVQEVFPGVLEFGLFEVFQRVWRTGVPEHHPVGLYKDERMEGWRENFVYKLPSGEIVAVYRDQTEREKARQALEAEKRRFEALAESSPFGMVVVRQDGCYEYVNPKFHEVLGYDQSDILTGREWSRKAFPDPDYRHEVIAAWFEDLEKASLGQLTPRIFTVTCKDGTQKTMKCILVPLPSGEHVITFEDITQRQAAEEALRKSEEKYRNIFDNAVEGIFQSTPEGRLISVNAAYTRMFGYGSPEEMVRDATDVASQLYANPADREAVKQRLRDPAPLTDYEIECRRKDGTRFWISMDARSVWDESGKLLRYDGTVQDITARKRAEDSLKESERNYRELVSNANSAIMRWKSDGAIMYFNEYAQSVFGYSEEEALGKHVGILVPETESTGRDLSTLVRDVVEHPESYVNNINENICKDGRRIWMAWTNKAILDDAGKVAEIFAIGADITEQKRTEEALDEAKELYRSVFDNAALGIDVVDDEGKFLQVNKAFANMLGYSQEELLNLTIFDITHPEDVQDSQYRYRKMLRGETEAYQFDKRYIRKDGEVLYANVSVTAVRDPEGGHKATIGVIADITRRKAAEAERERLSRAIEQAAEEVVISDVDGTIRYVNPAFEKITGYAAREAIGQNPRFLKSGEHDTHFYAELWNTIKTGSIWSGRFTNRRKDGSLYTEDATISPVKDSSGQIVNFVAVKRDVTEQLALSKQLYQAQKMEAVGTLAGGVAHDFNNVLQVALGYSDLILGDENFPDRYRKDLKKILESARRGADLVQRLLTFSRKTEIKLQPINLNHRINELRKMLERTLPKMIHIQLSLDEDIATINADPTQIDQVLMNLAVNARDAMPDGGRLIFETSNLHLDEEYTRGHLEASVGNHVRLMVTDTGSGMDQETLQHIFEPFYTTKGLGEGTGLGLAMVHGIVKQHGGHITCYSNPGEGTVFKIYFPSIETEIEADLEATGIMPAFGTETVLLVDDEEFVRELGARILTKQGYTVLQAANGREALDVFEKKRSRISLVILDLIMPEMGGTECLLGLLKIDPNVKVIVASGYSADASVKRTIGTRAKGFVNKPFRVNELLRDVRRVLDEGQDQ